MVIGQDPHTAEWITRFEDGTEHRYDDPMENDDYTFLE